MRVRKPPLSARSATGKVVSTSLLYGTQTAYPLTYTPTPATDPVYNPATGEYDWPEPTGQGVTFEVFLEQSSRRNAPERPGLEEGQILLEGRVVKTPTGTPLEFPEGVKAGDTFDSELFGAKGTLTLLPTPVEQGPKDRKIRGRTFQAAFKTVG